MDVNVKSNGAIFEVSGKIKWEEIKNLYQQELEKFIKTVKIQGFRPGKAPPEVVERRYGEEIKAKAVGSKVSEILDLYSKEKKHWVDIVQNQEFVWSQVDDYINFSIKIEAIPRKKLDINVKLEKPEIKFSDDEVNREIEFLKERYAVAEDSDKSVISEEDIGVFDLVVKDVKTGKVNIKENDKVIYLKMAEDWFRNLVVGMRVGETKEVTVSTTRFSGKVTVTLKQIKNKVLPSNEDLAKALGYQSEAEMREDIKNKLLEDKKKRTLQIMYTNLILKIVEKNKVDLPKGLVAHMLEKYTNERHNLTQAQIESLAVFTASELVVLKNLKEDENIQVSDEEIKKYIKEEVFADKEVDEQTLNQLVANNDARERIEETIKLEKVRKMLEDKIVSQYLS